MTGPLLLRLLRCAASFGALSGGLADTPPPTFVEVPNAFAGEFEPGRDPFDALSADHDGDGDPDLLVNWHALGPLELFENDGGRLRCRTRRGRDRSGLEENPGVGELYAPAREVLARIRARSGPGVYLWHDVDRAGYWNLFLVADPAGPSADLRVIVEANATIEEVAGLEPDERRALDERSVSLEPREGWSERHVGLRLDAYAARLEVRVLGADPPPLFVGAEPTEVEGPVVELWKPDPHGMAWVDVDGDGGPELALCRGTIRGTVVPPLDPKANRFYRWTEGGTYRRDPAAVLPDYGRARQLEWVDADTDGRAELYVGNLDTPNQWLVWSDEAGGYRDRAPAAGLDFEGGDRFTWMDVDRDGDDDLLFVDGERLHLAENTGGATFRTRPAADLGLDLTLPALREGLFERTSLHVLDVDSDGRLDLWVSGIGEELRSTVYLATDRGFEDRTGALGLSALAGSWNLLRADLDDDGFEDAVSLGDVPVVLWNRGGTHFRPVPLGLPPSRVGAAADFDGDGAVDLALIGTRRRFLRNTSETGASTDVRLSGPRGAPVGTLVVAHFSDGRRRAQRLGSAANTGHSQAVAPLRFGVPAGVALERLTVRWPGSLEAVELSVDEPTPKIDVAR